MESRAFTHPCSHYSIDKGPVYASLLDYSVSLAGFSIMGFKQLFIGIGAIGIGFIVGLTSVVAQEVTNGLTADTLEELLSGADMNPDIMADKETGAPVAVGKIGQINFVVRALECDGTPMVCSQLLFFSNFDLGREPTQNDYRIVNDFNDSSVDGRAYVLEETNQIGIDYYIDLTGGVTQAHIASRLSRWQGVIESFLQEMRSANTGS